jgi:hypothetical protein
LHQTCTRKLVRAMERGGVSRSSLQGGSRAPGRGSVRCTTGLTVPEIPAGPELGPAAACWQRRDKTAAHCNARVPPPRHHGSWTMSPIRARPSRSRATPTPGGRPGSGRPSRWRCRRSWSIKATAAHLRNGRQPRPKTKSHLAREARRHRACQQPTSARVRRWRFAHAHKLD